MRKTAAIALVSAAAMLALVPAAAAGKTITRTAGDVTATLSWKKNFADTKDLRLAIDRAGTTVYDQKVKAKDCGEPIPGFACPWPPLAKALQLHDLDGDGEADVVVSGFTGGAHCCLLALVYHWNGTAYEKSEYNFLDPGFTLADLNGDGRFEFVSRDPRFLYLYGSFAESVTPIQIFAFDGEEFSDVTTDFTPAVADDAKTLKREYKRRARSRRQFGVRPAIAAYVADLYTLGRRQDAKQTLQKALDEGLLDRNNRFEIGPFGEKFIASLNRYLRKFGYR